MIWKGDSENLHGERDGRRLEVKKHDDGTWRLFVGQTRVGIFAAREVACLAGENMPLNDAAIKLLAADPYAATRFADNGPAR